MRLFYKPFSPKSGQIILKDSPKFAYFPVYDEVISEPDPQARSELPPLRYRVPNIMRLFYKPFSPKSGQIILKDSPKFAYLPVYDEVISEPDPVIFPCFCASKY